MPTQARAALSNLTFSLSMAMLNADLLPVSVSRSTKSDGVSFTNVCPTCVDPHKLKQQYRCSHNPQHGPFGPSDADKALQVDGKLIKVDREAIEEVVTDEEDSSGRHAELAIYPAAQVEQHTSPSGTPYRLRPRKGAEEHYAAFLHMAANPNFAILCELAPKKVKKLYRLVAQHGMITLMELTRPEEMYPAAPVEVALAPKALAFADQLVENLAEDFDPSAYADQRKRRMNELRTTLGPAEELEPAADIKHAATDLLAMLELSVAQAKAAA